MVHLQIILLQLHCLRLWLRGLLQPSILIIMPLIVKVLQSELLCMPGNSSKFLRICVYMISKFIPHLISYIVAFMEPSTRGLQYAFLNCHITGWEL